MSTLTIAQLANIAIDSISLIIIIGMAIYGVKLLFAMRGILEDSWRRISVGSIFLACGVTCFALEEIFSIVPAIIMVHYIGGLCMISGGSLLLLGLRSQYKVWVPKKELLQQKEKLKDLS